MEEAQKEYKIYHKIEANRKIRVFKSTYNDRNYYRVQITQKNYDNTENKFYINLQFKKGVNLDNETDIIIKEAYENFRVNPKDQYNPIMYLMVKDFEIQERQEQLESQAYEKFQETLNNNEQGTDDEILQDTELPF